MKIFSTFKKNRFSQKTGKLPKGFVKFNVLPLRKQENA